MRSLMMLGAWAVLWIPCLCQAQDSGLPRTDDPAAAPSNRLIYVPFKNIRSVLDNPEATAIVPYREYLRLLDQVGQTLLKPRRLPAGITSAEYSASVTGDVVRLQARLRVRAFEAGWSELPLNYGQAAVGKVAAENADVVLTGRGPGQYALLLPDAGEYDVTLELSTRVLTSTEGRHFELRCPAVGITTFELTLPQADQTVDIQPQLVPLAVEQPEGQTRIRSHLGSTDQIRVRWNPQQSLKPEMELLTSVRNTLHAHIDEGLLHQDATLRYQILRGELEQLRIAVDARDRILDVETADARMRGWRTAEADGQKIVTVELLSPVSDKLTVTVHTERPVSFDEALLLGGRQESGASLGIHSLDTVRETGILVVSHDAELTLAAEQVQGLSRIDAGEVPDSARLADAVYYRFFSPDFRLPVQVRPVEARLVVTQLATVTLQEDTTELESHFSYRIERAGVFSLSWKLPENLRVTSVSSPIMNSYRVDESTGTLTMSLKEKYQGELAVALSGEIAGETADGELLSIPIPEPVLPNGESRETGTVMIYAPPSVEVTADTGSLTGVQPGPVISGTRGRTTLVASWVYNRRPVAISVSKLRKPARLTAEQSSHVSVAPELVRLTSRITFTVENAGLDTFQIAVPEALAPIAEVTAAEGQTSIKQKPIAEEAVDGFKTITITTQQDVLGSQTFVVSYDLPRQEAEDQRFSATIPFPRVQSALRDETEISVSQYTAEVTVEKDRSLSIQSEPAGADIETIDLRELQITRAVAETAGTSRTSVALAYRYHEQPASVTIQASRAEIQEVVQTVVPRALHELVVGRESLATFRSRFRIVSSERQRLRIDLPGEQGTVEVIDARVDGRQVSLEQTELETESGWVAYYVNVARQGSADEPFTLSVQFRSPVSESGSQPFSGRGGRIVLRLPQLGDSTAGNVAVQQTRLMTWVPDRITLVGQPEGFVVQQTRDWWQALTSRRRHVSNGSDGTDWIGFEASGAVEFPTEGHTYIYDCLGSSSSLEVSWWEQVFLIWVLSGALLAVGFVLRKTPWENKLSLLLLMGFAATLYGLQDPQLVLQGVLSARIGLLGMLLVWSVHAVFGRGSAQPRQRPPRRRKGQGGSSPPPLAAVVPPPGVFKMQLEQMQKKSNG